MADIVPADQNFLRHPSLTTEQRKLLQRRDAPTRLDELKYDPLKALVDQHNAILAEIERQEKMRDGEIVELTASGRPRAFNMDNLHRLREQAIAIGDKLLRYGYSRVPEKEEEARPLPSSLVVVLNKSNDKFQDGSD
jgi:antitoxin (DNA-binding transcriptional repressor) of toxin-antitoxin stability system